jgi:hypothetical protein
MRSRVREREAPYSALAARAWHVNDAALELFPAISAAAFDLSATACLLPTLGRSRVRPCGVKRAQVKNGGKLCEHDDVTQASRAPIKLSPSLRKKPDRTKSVNEGKPFQIFFLF